jgi:hypothetical protein
MLLLRMLWLLSTTWVSPVDVFSCDDCVRLGLLPQLQAAACWIIQDAVCTPARSELRMVKGICVSHVEDITFLQRNINTFRQHKPWVPSQGRSVTQTQSNFMT